LFIVRLIVKGAMTEVTLFWMREALKKQTSKEVWEAMGFSRNDKPPTKVKDAAAECG
jgi:hypothetical protein